jgi:hypothetical protein
MWVSRPSERMQTSNVMQHHEMLKDTIGENYFGPVHELLITEPDRHKRVGKSLFIMSEHSI